MDFCELIASRRSVRSFESAVHHEDLVEILLEAQQAPSWKNQQTSRCYVIESPEILEEFRKLTLPSFNQKSSANAALIVTTYVRNIVGFDGVTPVNEIGNGWGAYDLGLHDAFMILAAKNAGYDTLIMGIRDADVIREKLPIPSDEEIMSVIAVGKRKANPSAPSRKSLDSVVQFF